MVQVYDKDYPDKKVVVPLTINVLRDIDAPIISNPDVTTVIFDYRDPRESIHSVITFDPDEDLVSSP